MKIYVLDGGPRKKWNTAQMSESFAKGAQIAGAEVEILRLYDMNYKGCTSCFACKVKDGKSYGRCGYKDELQEVLGAIAEADGVALASPIYLGTITAQLHGFIERLLFPFTTYTEGYQKIAPKALETAVLYTMNVGEEIFHNQYLGKDNTGPIGFFEHWIGSVFTKPERVCAYNTYQFTDYDKYVSSCWDEAAKRTWQEEHFPQDLDNAYQAGVRMVEKIKAREE